MIEKYEKDPFPNSLSYAQSNMMSKVSLTESINDINSYLQNQEMPRLKGQAESKKNLIVMKSKTNELSHSLSKRSQLNANSLMERIKPSKRYVEGLTPK